MERPGFREEVFPEGPLLPSRSFATSGAGCALPARSSVEHLSCLEDLPGGAWRAGAAVGVLQGLLRAP